MDPIDPDDAGSGRGHRTPIYRSGGLLAGLGRATGAVVATDTACDGGTDVDVVGEFTGGVQRWLNVRR